MLRSLIQAENAKQYLLSAHERVKSDTSNKMEETSVIKQCPFHCVLMVSWSIRAFQTTAL